MHLDQMIKGTLVRVRVNPDYQTTNPKMYEDFHLDKWDGVIAKIRCVEYSAKADSGIIHIIREDPPEPCLTQTAFAFRGKALLPSDNIWLEKVED